jgi:hypothetical protein
LVLLTFTWCGLHRKHHFQQFTVVAYISVAEGVCLLGCCLAVAAFSGSAILPFRHHVSTVLYKEFKLLLLKLQMDTGKYGYNYADYLIFMIINSGLKESGIL